MMKKISRDEVFDLIVQIRLKTLKKEQTLAMLEDYEIYESSNIKDDMLKVVTYSYNGTTNGFLSEIYEVVSGERVEVEGDRGKLYPCPCCGYETLSELYDVHLGTGYDICKYCGWEDDGTSDRDSISSVNKGTMNQYLKKIANESEFYYREKWYKR